MSKVFDLAGLVKAMATATDFIQAEVTKWQVAPAASPQAAERQQQLVDRLQAIVLDLARIPELRGWASASVEELNGILAREGFDIRLEPWQQNGDQFGVVSVLDITVKWAQSGENTIILAPTPDRSSQQGYPAFQLNARANAIDCYRVPGTTRPAIRITTQSGDVVWMHVLPSGQPPEYYQLYDLAAKIMAERQPDAAYAGVQKVFVPKIKLRQDVDISWVAGCHAAGYTVTQALQQVRFVMNQHGARAKTATAMALLRCAHVGITEVLIDDDFLFWIERPGVTMPLFVGYFTTADWRDPGSLDNV